MKNIVITALSVYVSLLLVSCSLGKTEMPDLHIMSMQLVSFNSPEYTKYVVADRVAAEWDTIKGVRTKSAYKILWNGGACQELFLGQSPYIELADGYYLVDWKWGNFIYQPSNVLLDAVWTDVQDRQQVWWDSSTPVISSDFIKHWGHTNRVDIDKYLQITPAANDERFNVSTDHVRFLWLGEFHTLADMQESFGNGAEDYMQEVARQDSLQRVYVERLTKIIKEGGLKKVAYIYKN